MQAGGKGVEDEQRAVLDRLTASERASKASEQQQQNTFIILTFLYFFTFFVFQLALQSLIFNG